MAKVRNLAATGLLNGVQWPDVGETCDIDVPDNVLADLVASKTVELVKSDKPAKAAAAKPAKKAAAAKKVEKRPASKAGVETRSK